jgi:long-chain acyl-CoA synthetase
MVAPLPNEEELKASPENSQVCMVGDGRKYLSALITLSEPVLKELGEINGRIVKDPKILGEVKAAVDQLNHKLASYEQIKRFTVLSREFSIADGEMTPTLKMKRNVIEQRFSDLIEEMYK